MNADTKIAGGADGTIAENIQSNDTTENQLLTLTVTKSNVASVDFTVNPNGTSLNADTIYTIRVRKGTNQSGTIVGSCTVDDDNTTCTISATDSSPTSPQDYEVTVQSDTASGTYIVRIDDIELTANN